MHDILDNDTLIEAQLEFARNSMIAFIYATMPTYIMGWVHEEICNKLDRFLQDVINKKSPRLMLTMPPRHGKSEIVSKRFVAYAFGKYPDLSIIGTSYSSDLITRINRDIQRIIDNDTYKKIFPNTQIGSKNVRTVAQGNYLRNSDIFEIVNYKGVYRSAGVGGGITGLIVCPAARVDRISVLQDGL